MKDFFFFTRGERNGLCLLLAIVCATIAISSNLAGLLPPPHEDAEEFSQEFNQELEKFKASLKKAPPKREKEQNHRNKSYAHHQPQGAKTERQEKQNPPKAKEPLSIEINSADTTEFKKLRGIGSTYAARIVKFRGKLGGFYSVEQIKEVYGINAELYESIRPSLKANPSDIKKIDINDEAFTFGFYHPYMPKGGVAKLVKQREKSGRVERDSVKRILELDEKEWNRLKHYLSE